MVVNRAHVVQKCQRCEVFTEDGPRFGRCFSTKNVHGTANLYLSGLCEKCQGELLSRIVAVIGRYFREQ